MDIFVCECGQGIVLGEDEDEDVEERFLDNIINYWTSSDQHGDRMVEASDEEPYIFYFDILCMFAYFAGDEHQLDDVLMHIDK